MPAKINIDGQRFGRLTVVRRVGKDHAVCTCDCGNSVKVRVNNLRRGLTRSCRCWHREITGAINRTHGMTGSPTYKSWQHMIERCTKPSDPSWHRYGGRGITVCRRWEFFANFLEDMGEKPPKMTLERIDNDGNYEPGNCQWASRTKQANNRRTSTRHIFNGKEMTLAEIAAKTGVKYPTLWARVNRGQDVHKAAIPY